MLVSSHRGLAMADKMAFPDGHLQKEGLANRDCVRTQLPHTPPPLLTHVCPVGEWGWWWCPVVVRGLGDAFEGLETELGRKPGEAPSSLDLPSSTAASSQQHTCLQ